MIRVDELRVGNWVNDGYNHYEQVWGLVKDESKGDSINGHPCDVFKPIPLTEKILLNMCGFEKIVTEGNFDLGYGDEISYGLEFKREFYLSYLDDFSVGIFSSKKASNDELGICIPLNSALYLHQLQNIYFMLSGEELEIKL
jgi:hypothetical protein